jgi:hypothetical protein
VPCLWMRTGSAIDPTSMILLYLCRRQLSGSGWKWEDPWKRGRLEAGMLSRTGMAQKSMAEDSEAGAAGGGAEAQTAVTQCT